MCRFESDLRQFSNFKDLIGAFRVRSFDLEYLLRLIRPVRDMKKKLLSWLLFAGLFTHTFCPAFCDDEIVVADSLADLRVRKNLCIRVGLHAPQRNRTSEQFLVSIDGESLRSLTLAQVKKKLSGPAGSPVKMEIGYSTGETEIIELVRQSPIKQHASLGSNSDEIRSLERASDRVSGSTGYGNLMEKSSVNCDLIAKNECSGQFKENLLAAGLCEQSKDYANAAKYYSEAAKYGGGASNQQSEEFLRKAVTCANRAPSFDKSALAKIYVELSSILERHDLAEGLSLREKAVALLSDSDPEKPNGRLVLLRPICFPYIPGQDRR